MATKQCKFCKTEIDKKASVCPNCKRAQSNSGCLVAFIIFFVVICVGIAIISSTSTTSSDTTTPSKNSEFITLDEFNQIQAGMTYEQVVNIIGSNGTLTSDVSLGNEAYHTQIYMWYGNRITGANANITFQGGKVVSKAQFGL